MTSPIVNGLENELGTEADVIRVNLLSALGQQIAGELNVDAARTNLVLDATGKEVLRTVGAPDRERILSLIRGV